MNHPDRPTAMAKTPSNQRAEEATYETILMPNLANERSRLAREAASLTATELRERAAEAGISTSGTSSKTELVERVQEAARGTPTS